MVNTRRRCHKLLQNQTLMTAAIDRNGPGSGGSKYPEDDRSCLLIIPAIFFLSGSKRQVC